MSTQAVLGVLSQYLLGSTPILGVEDISLQNIFFWENSRIAITIWKINNNRLVFNKMLYWMMGNKEKIYFYYSVISANQLLQ